MIIVSFKDVTHGTFQSMYTPWMLMLQHLTLELLYRKLGAPRLSTPTTCYVVDYKLKVNISFTKNLVQVIMDDKETIKVKMGTM